MFRRIFNSIARRRLALLAVFLLSILAAVLFRRAPVKAEAQILPMPEKPPTYPSHPLDSWIPMKWSSLWRIRYAILGYNPSIHINPSFTDLSETSQELLASLLPAIPPLAQTNGTQAWILPPDEYRVLQTRLRAVANASEAATLRFTTGPWVQANIASGSQATIGGTSRWYGLNANIYTRLKGKAVELATLFTLSEVVTNPPPAFLNLEIAEFIEIQTNLTVAARFVVPESNGVFVLDSSRFTTEHKRTAIFIAPRIEPYLGPGPSRKK